VIDANRTEAGKPTCPKCGSGNVVIGGKSGPHFGSVRCRDCGQSCWLPKPENEKKRRRSSLGLARKYSRGFCDLCQRTPAELPHPEVLEGHHVKEVVDGGTDDRSNVWVVCSSCHALIHHQRTYLGHYR